MNVFRYRLIRALAVVLGAILILAGFAADYSLQHAHLVLVLVGAGVALLALARQGAVAV